MGLPLALSGAVEQGAQPVQGVERFARRQAVGSTGACSRSHHDVADTALTTDGGPAAPGIKQPPPRYDLSRTDFSRLRAEFDAAQERGDAMDDLFTFNEGLDEGPAARPAGRQAADRPLEGRRRPLRRR
jgi:hypothetical protein